MAAPCAIGPYHKGGHEREDDGPDEQERRDPAGLLKHVLELAHRAHQEERAVGRRTCTATDYQPVSGAHRVSTQTLLAYLPTAQRLPSE